MPTQVLMAIRTMEVGVETFSLTLKSRERTENEQMSTPLPATELKMPPRKPTASRMAACQAPNLGIKSNVFLLCSLLRRKRAKAKLNQMQTKLSFFSGGVKAVSTTSRPKIMPAMAPRLQKTRECHSSFTFIQKMVKAAADMPQDWIIKLKSRATAGLMPRASVITGKATAPPPSLVIPATRAPKIIVMERR